MEDSINRLTEALGYRFARTELLHNALTHRSADARNNERLEFLGDAILNLVVAEHLYHKFPDCDEGSLSRLRASVVKGETLAGIARTLELGSHLILGSGEIKNGGHQRPSILADTLEAIIGAIYLDSDLATIRETILTLFQIPIEQLDPSNVKKDPKTRLQEYLQARHQPLPDYEVEQIQGLPHAQHFTVTCRIKAHGVETRGEGHKRRTAEQAAATLALARLGQGIES